MYYCPRMFPFAEQVGSPVEEPVAVLINRTVKP
jgi:hypothetical protein